MIASLSMTPLRILAGVLFALLLAAQPTLAASGERAAIFRKYGLPEDRIRHILNADAP
ncbi:hypothetical protein [Pseudodesulfovibrio methanolicus]|uniref:Uncharacterized protein n=1 Tax=Pseudodesulfovibrio methanolicus TaxID=3126690 RepID=A0ABZ2IZ56_9BACT